MATLADALVTKVLGHSAAEKTFRPWWDQLEDYLIYGLVMLGLIVLPTAIINGTPLDCTFCQGEICPSLVAKNETFRRTMEDPGFNAWWVKKYCTMTAVDRFVMYFPYILLIMALVIVLIERGFVSIFRAGLKLDAFYNLLVKEALIDETKPSKKMNKSGDEVDSPTNEEDKEAKDSQLAFEVAHSFKDSSSYFYSYLVRTVAELVVAVALFAWLVVEGFPTLERDEFIYCDVHGFKYECAGHPQQFYLYILFATVCILVLYILCCSFNLLWLVLPQLGSMSRAMALYRRESRRRAGASGKSDRELLGDLYDVYYDNRDLKLLLDLLATSSGIAPCLRILCMFDRQLQEMAKVRQLSVSTTPAETDVVVTFDDARAMTDVFGRVKGFSCVYVVEIVPAIKTGSVLALKFCPAGDDKCEKKRKPVMEDGDTELKPLSPANLMSARFRGIDPNKQYCFRVSTVINGKTIARQCEALLPQTTE